MLCSPSGPRSRVSGCISCEETGEAPCSPSATCSLFCRQGHVVQAFHTGHMWKALTPVSLFLFSCRSTAYNFNPKPANPSFLSHSLVELLNQISPTFKKNFSALQKKR